MAATSVSRAIPLDKSPPESLRQTFRQISVVHFRGGCAMVVSNILNRLAFWENSGVEPDTYRPPAERIGHGMNFKRFGDPPRRPTPKEVLSTEGAQPGLGWEVSEKTQRDIEEIEANSRAAEQQSGSIVFG